jgi:flavin reductase (DIM6/NTAB) family NADH-FMN oxidoreductase RutF
VIDPETKRAIGQMIKGVQVVGATHDGVVRAYCSHWVSQVAFEEPIIMASVSPKHDTHPLLAASGLFAVSVLAADQVDIGQYFSYPGRRFRHIATEYLEDWDGLPVVPKALSWLRCEIFERKPMADHDLFFARVTKTAPGRLGDPPLLYSARHGWRVTGGKAREPGMSIRDRLLERLAKAGIDTPPESLNDDGSDGGPGTPR